MNTSLEEGIRVTDSPWPQPNSESRVSVGPQATGERPSRDPLASNETDSTSEPNRTRRWPIVTLGLVLLAGIAVVSWVALRDGDSAPTIEASNEIAPSAAPASTTTTSTASPPTSTVPPTTAVRPTTTPAPVVLTPAEHQLVAKTIWDSSMRSELIEALGNDQSVQSVDLVVFDTNSDTIVVDVTSRWSSYERQQDAAWEITRAFATFWDTNETPIFRQPGWSPSFRFVNSGAEYHCSAEFMAALADVIASRSDWESQCVVAPVAAEPTPVTVDPAREQLEADIRTQRNVVATLETAAARARSEAESETPIYQARIADATAFGATQAEAALQAEFDAMWAEVDRIESELASARTVLGDLEARL